MFTWIKANALHLMGYALLSSIASLAIMFTLWQGAQHDAKVYHDMVTMQNRVIEAQSRITQNETRVNRVVETHIQRIMESPNANTPVPNDLAAAWADGIDSVWNDGTSQPDGPAAHVHGPARPETRG